MLIVYLFNCYCNRYSLTSINMDLLEDYNDTKEMEWEEIYPGKFVCHSNIALSYNWRYVKDKEYNGDAT